MKPIFIECEVRNGVRFVRMETVEKVVNQMHEENQATMILLREVWTHFSEELKLSASPAFLDRIKERLGL